jgi:hypothetical protein
MFDLEDYRVTKKWVIITEISKEVENNTVGRLNTCVKKSRDVENPIDSGIVLSIRIDNRRVFINKTLSTESLINQLLIKRDCLSICIDSR